MFGLIVESKYRAFAGLLIVLSGLELQLEGQVTTISRQKLEPGEIITRELSGKDNHLFSISVGSGDLVRVTIDQQGIDVLAKLDDPSNGASVISDHSFGLKIPEVIRYQSNEKQTLMLSVSQTPNGRRTGSYSVSIEIF